MGFLLSCFSGSYDMRLCLHWALVAQSVYRLVTGWTVPGSNSGGDEIFRTCPDRPWGPPNLLYNRCRFFPEGKERPGRDVDPSLLLVPWSRKSRAIPLLPLLAVRPVQSLSVCTRLHFTFFLLCLKRNIQLIESDWETSVWPVCVCVCVKGYLCVCVSVSVFVCFFFCIS